MTLAYISTDVASQVCERVAYGMCLIAVTIGIGVALAFAVRPKK
jgi:hypothetical protein